MKKQRHSRQRKLILDIVSSRHDHPTADQIYLDVRAQDDKISRGTVYRNLGILSENGEIANIKVPSADRYDSRTERHYHMFCINCGRVFDVPLEYQKQYDEQTEKETDFKIYRHRLVFEGLCPECSLAQNNNK